METANSRMTLQKMSGIPGYADGGLIDSFKRAVGMAPPESMRDKFARQDAERAAKRPAPQVATEAPTKAISAYAGNTALDARMAANPDAKAAGGPITGKGGPKEDNIPIMASNGEFVIRAAAAKAIGLPALTALNKLGGDLPEAPNTTDNKFEEGGAINGSKINRFGTEVPNTAAQGAQLANQTASYVAGAQAANPVQAAAPVAAPAAPQQGEYGRQMGEMGASFARGAGNIGRAMEVMGKTLVSAPGYGFSSDSPKAPAAAQAQLASPNAATMMQRQAGNAGSGDGREPYQPKYPIGNAQSAMAAPAPQESAATLYRSSGPVDQAGLDGIQSRQNTADTARASKAQFDSEVKAANAVNDWQAQQTLQRAAMSGNKNALAILSGTMGDATARRGQDITSRGQDLTAQTTQRGQDVTERTTTRGQYLNSADSTQRNGIARDRLSMDSQGAELDNAAKTKLMAAQDKLAMAKTDEEIAAATQTVRALTGKFGKEAPAEQYAYAPGGQEIDPTTGQTVTRPGVIFNKSTGQRADQQGQSALPPGMVKQVGTANGKPVYLDKNGKQVIAKG